LFVIRYHQQQKEKPLTEPITDSHWQKMSSFLVNRLNDKETILGPEGLKPLFDTPQFVDIVFQNYRTTTYLEAEDFDWAVIHKGMVENIDNKFLDQLELSLSPIFANSVFVIFSKRYKWRSLLLNRSFYLRKYYRIRRDLDSSRQRSNEALAEINGQEEILNKKFLRRADALLCSYPKCGRTWLRFMLGYYFHLSNQPIETMSLIRMSQVVPAVATRDKILGNDYLTAGQLEPHYFNTKFPLVVATHHTYSGPTKQMIFSTKDIILLVRILYDVLVSQYFERIHRKGDDDVNDIWEYICNMELVEAYVVYLNGWAENLLPERHAKRHIVLTYENLKKNTEQELIRVLQFLNLEIVPDYVAQAIEMSSFENMQKQQLQTREQRGIDDAQTNYAGLRTRRGKIGGYRDYLSDSAICAIHDYCQKHLNKAAQDLLSNNGIEP